MKEISLIYINQIKNVLKNAMIGMVKEVILCIHLEVFAMMNVLNLLSLKLIFNMNVDFIN